MTDQLLPPGTPAPASGLYEMLDEFGELVLDHEGLSPLQVTVTEGERLPPTDGKGWHYRLSESAHHEYEA